MDNQKPQKAGNELLSDRYKGLRANPFTTYRDPQTGRWIVVKPSATSMSSTSMTSTSMA